MPKDIRSYFSQISSKSASSSKTDKTKKNTKVLEVSSDEDEKKNKTNSKKNKLEILSSDSDDDFKRKRKKKKAKKESVSSSEDSENEKKGKNLKTINALEMFSKKPVERREKKENTRFDDSIFDDGFDEVLNKLDEKQLLTNKKEESLKEVEEKKKGVVATSKKDMSNCKQNDDSIDKGSSSSSKKRKRDLNESSAENDQERWEKKKLCASLYQSFLHRGGARNPGSKQIPKGKPGCFKSLTFLCSGVYESLERDEMKDIITSLGGRIIKAVSGKLDYLITGEEAGPAKIEKAKTLDIKIIDEDGFIELIKTKSGEGASENHQKKETSKAHIASDLHASEKLDLKRKSDEKTKEKNESSSSKDIKSAFLNKDRKSEDNVEDEEISQFFKKKTLKCENKKIEEMNSKKSPSKQMIDKKKSDKVKDELKHKETGLKNDFKRTTSGDDDKKKDAVKLSDDSKKLVDEENKKVAPTNLAWVDKYKPKNINQLIGQQNEANKLLNWLNNWRTNRTKNLPRPSPWAKNDNGGYFKAALLSGPPGVGKTTCASLVCDELGFDKIEFNASDTRNKKLIQDDISNLLINQSITGYFTQTKSDEKERENSNKYRHVLIMDEVDGMSGNEDRGGIQELINVIKKSSIPIICMCNDRNHPKIRSLSNYCYDLRFNKPKLEVIRASLMSICFKENVKVKIEVLNEMILSTNQDIRQSINQLALWASGLQQGPKQMNTLKKNTDMSPWEIVRHVFSQSYRKTMSLMDKYDLFFRDYNMGPLFIQDSYLSVTPSQPKNKLIKCLAFTSNSLSVSDMLEKKIRNLNVWSLLSAQATYCTVLPGEIMAGQVTGQINFPTWFGKNSKANKLQRYQCELHTHMRLRISGGRDAINLDYAPFLMEHLGQLMADEKIDETMDVLENYYLLREDLTNMEELTTWPNIKHSMSLVSSKTKSALTRLYNKRCPVTPFAPGDVVKIKMPTKDLLSEDNEIYEDNQINNDDDSDNDQNDDLASDKLIKVKKTSSKTSNVKASEASTSKKSKKSKK